MIESDVASIFTKYDIPTPYIVEKKKDKSDMTLQDMLNKYSVSGDVSNQQKYSKHTAQNKLEIIDVDTNITDTDIPKIVINCIDRTKTINKIDAIMQTDNNINNVYNETYSLHTNQNDIINTDIIQSVPNTITEDIEKLKQDIECIYTLHNENISQRKELFEIVNKKIRDLNNDVKKITKMCNKLKYIVDSFDKDTN